MIRARCLVLPHPGPTASDRGAPAGLTAPLASAPNGQVDSAALSESRFGGMLAALPAADPIDADIHAARVLVAAEQFFDALPLLDHAFAESARIGPPARPAEVALALAVTLSEIGCHDLAERYIGEARRRYSTLNDHQGMGRAQVARALTAYHAGNARHAIELSSEAIATLRGCAPTAVVSEWALNNHGVYLAADQRLADALPFLEESARVARRLGDNAVLIDSLINLADTRLALRWFHSTSAALDELTERLQVAGNERLTFELLFRWGQFWRQRDNWPLAKEHFERAANAAWTSNSAELMARAHESLAETFNALGDAERAQEHARQATFHHDRFNRQRVDQKVEAAALTRLRQQDDPGFSAVLMKGRSEADVGSGRADDAAATRIADLERQLGERAQSEARLRAQAETDPLTGCANRLVLASHLARSVGEAGPGERVAVMFIDLDRFKQVNDSLGHDVGDHVLKEVVARLLTCRRGDDLLARFGGDEFVYVMKSSGQNLDVIEMVNRLRRSFESPFVAAGQVLYLTCSIGISYFPDHSQSPTELIRYADLAMFDAKRRGRNGYGLFDRRMPPSSERRLSLESDLHGAAERGELALYFQPEAELASGSVTGFEALLRWQHPQRGMVLPSEFIPMAEDSGLIDPIGQWVIDQSCRQYAAWRSRLDESIRVAINLSPRQLHSPGLVESIGSRLDHWGLAGSSLQIEVTEGMLMDLSGGVMRRMSQLRDLGVTIALDDFGTGYSSLAYLSRLPIDTLKIDRSFVRGIAENPRQRALVGSMIGMAHSLAMNCIAEGVEDPSELDALRELGCDHYQGFLYARPAPAKALERLLLH